ncbi:lipase 3-like [Culicoides brevitarsis]|uniref:lipase 3-like n=1 Tax=Culicoides brevitarsis TaxID=469753 RepID=UPI00307BF90C
MLLSDILFQIYTLANLNLMLTAPNEDPVASLIKSSGYPVEKHEVLTKDGYIITLHRIPPRSSNSSAIKKPVLLVHALTSSGGQWVVNGNKSLAFMLSDRGFDVWIMHARGTSYSLKHRNLSPRHPRFWDFSWHEIGVYDVGGSIDYVLQKTQQKKVFYVGHSQGPTVFVVLMSMHPEYNEKVAAAYLLQPAIFIHNTYGFLRPAVKVLTQFARTRNFEKILFQNSLTAFFNRNVCGNKPFSVLCENMAILFYGGDTGQVVDKHNSMAKTVKYAFDNVSVKQLIHYGQVYGDEKFQMFDYGPEINRNIYNGSSTPPEYDLSRVTVPTIVMYGTRDALTTANDIKTLMEKLPNVKEVYKLPWNHGDLIVGKDTDLLFNRIIHSMERWNNEQVKI